MMKSVNLMKFLPLTAFIITARLMGMDELAWKNAFLE